MSTITGFRLTSAIITFTCSLLSAIGSGLILLCYLALPLKKHFRHVLILNLAVADFINSVNNSASGAQILMHRKDLSPGPGCVLNGFVGQLTVQATDTAIFAIAVVTVMTITSTSSSSRLISGEWAWPQILGATLSIWFLPAITSFLALGKEWYVPVSGNWCWLVNKPTYLRYVLTHGWRYLFMLLEIILYTYLHFYLRRHFRNLAVPLTSNPPASNDTYESGATATTQGTQGTNNTQATNNTRSTAKSRGAFSFSRRTAQTPILEPITFSRNPDDDTRTSYTQSQSHAHERRLSSPSTMEEPRYYRRPRGESVSVAVRTSGVEHPLKEDEDEEDEDRRGESGMHAADSNRTSIAMSRPSSSFQHPTSPHPAYPPDYPRPSTPTATRIHYGLVPIVPIVPIASTSEPPSPITPSHDGLSVSTHIQDGEKDKGATKVDVETTEDERPPTYTISTHPVIGGEDDEKTPHIHSHTHPPSKHSLTSFSFKQIARRRRRPPPNPPPILPNPRQRAIQRILLLNAYPLLYILLWIPGLANRLVEASGHTSKVSQILQASTQLVGLANAVTYGWNERIGRQLRERYFRWRSGEREPASDGL
ncbi:hypothetical protein PLEOSDRAFT_1111885 [Pleurotus ostreatus PC15]|uniref:Glucose receptor Git3-like N-terminal domain-containing protein n=1 Tax=Pleurotus ostreatus (strain PC15) TaxID=1137138 RepID=A0A067NNN0_PLEO1|nr:hypothetical protein PLEOSDRAFT_1111885 [Pleurotus ostreatus PC15]